MLRLCIKKIIIMLISTLRNCILNSFMGGRNFLWKIRRGLKKVHPSIKKNEKKVSIFFRAAFCDVETFFVKINRLTFVLWFSISENHETVVMNRNFTSCFIPRSDECIQFFIYVSSVLIPSRGYNKCERVRVPLSFDLFRPLIFIL